jgi:hypothetical protein
VSTLLVAVRPFSERGVAPINRRQRPAG